MRARRAEIAPEDVVDAALTSLPDTASALRPVLNGTGVILHTNLGRAALSAAAVTAIAAASGYVDVEYDLATGVRARRGRSTLNALLAAVPAAEDALVVNNGAAALVLAATALASGSGNRRQPGRVGGDRRRVPHPRSDREHRCATARSRHDQSHSPERLPSRGRTRNRLRAEGPPIEFHRTRIHVGRAVASIG